MDQIRLFFLIDLVDFCQEEAYKKNTVESACSLIAAQKSLIETFKRELVQDKIAEIMQDIKKAA